MKRILLFINGDLVLGERLRGFLEDQGYDTVLADGDAAPEVYDGISGMICLPERIDEVPLTEFTRDAADRAYENGYKAMLLRAKNAANAMIADGIHGSIVFVTDMDGIRSSRHDFLSGALHAALHRSAESLALQLAPHGIRINCLAPGRVAEDGRELSGTKRFPMERCGCMSDVCEAALWLVSDHSSYVTGTVLKCDGGNTLAGMPECEAGYGWDRERDLTPAFSVSTSI